MINLKYILKLTSFNISRKKSFFLYLIGVESMRGNEIRTKTVWPHTALQTKSECQHFLCTLYGGKRGFAIYSTYILVELTSSLLDVLNLVTAQSRTVLLTYYIIEILSFLEE